MQVTYIGLSEYFQRCIPKAKSKEYVLIISLIARYSDAQDLYEKLEKDWASLNDVTGYNISEKEIPCLFLYDLIGNRYKVIPVGQSTNIYVMIKDMVEKIAEYGKKRENIENQLENYKNIEKYYCLYEKLENEAEKGNSKDFVRDLLKMAKYDVIDQTRRGSSLVGKCAGEVDILIEKDGLPVTIIEALNLDSLNISYLDNHIDKIFSYDTVGNIFNIVLSYVSVSDFSMFCEKYSKHIKEYQYPYSLYSYDDSFIVEDFPYSDIRVMKTVHNRNGYDTVLYHVCVLIGR